MVVKFCIQVVLKITKQILLRIMEKVPEEKSTQYTKHEIKNQCIHSHKFVLHLVYKSGGLNCPITVPKIHNILLWLYLQEGIAFTGPLVAQSCTMQKLEMTATSPLQQRLQQKAHIQVSYILLNLVQNSRFIDRKQVSQIYVFTQKYSVNYQEPLDPLSTMKIKLNAILK